MKVHFSASGLDLTTELEKYANKKIARLNRKVPRGVRPETTCDVRFAQVRKKGEEFNSCSISFRLGKTELKVEETTLHMYTSLDIASVHMERQLVDYAAKHGGLSLRARLKRSLRRSK